MEYGNNKKKIVFYDTDDRHASLKIKLQYHGLSQSAFFRATISGLLEDDEWFLKFMHSYKEENDIQSKRQRQAIDKERQDASKINKSFQLEKSELSDIFDMIEKEHPDL